MTNFGFTDVTHVHTLLTNLQAIYWQLIEVDPTERADYFRQRIAIIEQARSRISMDRDLCLPILDEFVPEYEIMQVEYQKAYGAIK